MDNYIKHIKNIDSKFIYFIFFNYIKYKENNRDYFDLANFITEDYYFGKLLISQSDLFLAYRKWYDVWIFQDFWDKDNQYYDNVKYWAMPWSYCKFNFKAFEDFSELYFKNLKANLLKGSKGTPDNFSSQFNKLIDFFFQEEERTGKNSFQIDISDRRFSGMYITDLVYYLYFYKYIDVWDISIWWSFIEVYLQEWFYKISAKITNTQKDIIIERSIKDRNKELVNKTFNDKKFILYDNWDFQLWENEIFNMHNIKNSHYRSWICFLFSILKEWSWKQIIDYQKEFESLRRIFIKRVTKDLEEWTFSNIHKRFSNWEKIIKKDFWISIDKNKLEVIALQ